MSYEKAKTTNELAEILSVSPLTIRRALKAGKPVEGWKAVKVGSAVRWVREQNQ